MKRTERHHLKENELRTFARHAAEAVEARGRETTIVLLVVAAIAVVALGNSMQATVVFQQVIDKAGDSFYGQMARLGHAEAMARAGQYDQAINTFKEMSQRKDGPLPVDGILMQLGKTYLEAGKRADAQQTFNRLIEEYPESPFTTDARRELETLKKT